MSSTDEASPVEGIVRCDNPHWVGDQAAWDITLSDGTVHKDVTRRQIGEALQELYARGELHTHDLYIDVVRHCHILNYNKVYTSNVALSGWPGKDETEAKK